MSYIKVKKKYFSKFMFVEVQEILIIIRNFKYSNLEFILYNKNNLI